jgi:hypothetical protein
MAGRNIFRLVALVGLLGSVGCQHWCAEHYPCQPPPAGAGYQPCCCAPCQPVGYAPAQGWNSPGTPCPSGCVSR